VHGALELRIKTGNPFRGNLDLILEYFDLANAEGLGYGHQAILRVKQAVGLLSAQESADFSAPLRRFLALCQRPGRVGRMLRCMNDVGLIGLLIPDFNHIYCHSHHDIYHIYTTDEHTITVVRQLAYLPATTGRELASLRAASARIADREAIVLGCFYHDIGKGLGPGHSVTGARLSFAFMEKAGFSPSRCQLVSNLVRYHLLMNDVIQRRDLDDPKTIRDFLVKVETPAFLHNLYVLTYCDTSSVHPDAWSAWKANLLQKLYGVVRRRKLHRRR
jgi:[protein-PII] uridylyltransferase